MMLIAFHYCISIERELFCSACFAVILFANGKKLVRKRFLNYSLYIIRYNFLIGCLVLNIF